MARRRDEEEGFTLIELMVVVLIIAILIAIAIPTFLGARQRAQDRAAQSSLRNALTAAKTIYTDTNDYTSVNVTNLQSVEPSLSYTTGASSTQNQVNFAVSGTGSQASQIITLSAQSKSGKCFWLQSTETSGSGPAPGTQYGSASGSCGTSYAGTWASSW